MAEKETELHSYDPPLEPVVQLFVLAISMGYDFALIMSAILSSTKMVTIWILGSPLRGLISLGTGIWVIVVRKEDYTMSICSGVYFILDTMLVVIGVIVSLPFWKYMMSTVKTEEIMERRWQAQNIERLREAVRQATLLRRDELQDMMGSDSSSCGSVGSDDAAAQRTLYVRAVHQVHSYAYRHQRDLAYHAPRIAY